VARNATRKRIRRLRNRIKRTEARLRACAEIDRDGARRSTLLGIVAACASSESEFEALVDDVADRLDALIELANPIAEWLSDVGIDIAAFAAVVIWKGTRARLEKRLARDKATLARLEK
jgi:hypothetical protein